MQNLISKNERVFQVGRKNYENLLSRRASVVFGSNSPGLTHEAEIVGQILRHRLLDVLRLVSGSPNAMQERASQPFEQPLKQPQVGFYYIIHILSADSDSGGEIWQRIGPSYLSVLSTFLKLSMRFPPQKAPQSDLPRTLSPCSFTIANTTYCSIWCWHRCT